MRKRNPLLTLYGYYTILLQICQEKSCLGLTISVIFRFNNVVDVTDDAVNEDIEDEKDDQHYAEPIGVVHCSLLI